MSSLHLPPLITLTTDFGQADGYVGTMKGVMLARAPEARLVDLSHEIAPQDVPGGAFVLWRAYRYFPPGTVHLAVVDPGVGTARRALVLETAQGRFVGPDNGLFSLVLREVVAEAVGWKGTLPDVPAVWHPDFDLVAAWRGEARAGLPRAYALNNPAYWLAGPSATFHGRDIFAPVAAHLAAGVPPEQVGAPVSLESLALLPALTPTLRPGAVEGRVIAVDRFGNLITNIAAGLLSALGPAQEVRVTFGAHLLRGVQTAYGMVAAGAPLALINSAGLLEIAVRNGSAARSFQAGVGLAVVCQGSSASG